MDIIALAREIGKQIQASEEYTALQAAQAANENDQELQDLIGQFNVKRMQLNDEMTKEEKDDDKIKDIDKELQAVYAKIMENENMANYNVAKQGMDRIMDQINTILIYSANGEDPDTIDINPHECSGSCASCGGCH